MLTTKHYKLKDILHIPFKIAPTLLIAYGLLDLGQALLSSVAVVYVTALFVDTATTVLTHHESPNTLYLPLALLLSVVALNHLVEHALKLLSARLKMHLEHTLESEILERRARLSYKHIENADTWDLVERLSADIVYNIQYGIVAVTTVLRSIISLACILSLIVVQVWWAAVLLSLLSIPLFKLSLKAGQHNYNAWMAAWPYERRYSYYSDDILLSREATQERTLFGYAEHMIQQHQQHFHTARKIQEKVAQKTRITMESTGIFLSIIALLIAFFLVQPLMTGRLSAGMFIGIMTAVFAMATTMGGTLQEAAKDLSYARTCMEDLTTFMSLELQEGATDLPDTIPLTFERLSFKNVWFKYPNAEHYILEGVSFDLEANKHYAFVGKNGSGKTTLIKLLSGLYTDYDGEILINGKELRTYPLSTLKALFSIVYQDFARFQVSMATNIALGHTAEEVPLDTIQHIAEQVALTDTIHQLKDGLHTPLGKINAEGSDLSGGQWQKVAIARSLVSVAPIKILDDPTSNLDPIAESTLYYEFESLMKGKTTIFISHRLGSTKLADEILVIDKGKIIERGSHQQLMAINGLYSEMFDSQRKWYT